MTIAAEFAEYCVQLSYEDLPDDVTDYTKKLVLDTIGNAVGGYYWANSGDVMYGAASDLEPGSSDGNATVLATGNRLSPSNAALANGSLAHSLDYDNQHSRGNLHIGSSVVTAAMAAAETVNADGETFLEGVVAGYDVAARLGMACNPRSSHERGFHPTGTCGSFGATAAVAKIYGLDFDEIRTAFGINGSQASASYQCSITEGWNKRIHPGLAAHDAFISVALATNGFDGPTAPIEGDLGFLQAYADRPQPQRATDALGEKYEVAETTIKPYPFGTFTHVPIALLFDLMDDEDLSPDDIQELTVEMPTSGAAMFGRSEEDTHPTSAVEAQFDMPFAAALAIVRGEVNLPVLHDTLSGEYPEDFTRLMSATNTVGSEELEDIHPDYYPARIIVQTRSDTYERYRKWVTGEPDHPMSWDELGDKFDDLTTDLPESARSDIQHRVRNVESLSGHELLSPFHDNCQ